MKKSVVLTIIFFAVFVASTAYYLTYEPLEFKDGELDAKACIALITSLVSLTTAVISLITVIRSGKGSASS